MHKLRTLVQLPFRPQILIICKLKKKKKFNNTVILDVGFMVLSCIRNFCHLIFRVLCCIRIAAE